MSLLNKCIVFCHCWLVSLFWIVESAVDDFHIVPVNRQYISIHFAREQQRVASCIGLLVQGNHTSVIGLDARTLSSTRVLLPDLLTTAKYLIAYRADTVLPAPDSPLTMMDWFLWFLRKKKNTVLTRMYSTFYRMWLFELSFTWPSVCKPPLPLQIYEGPCLPCSGLSRHEWLHLHRYEAVCMDLQPPV